MRKYLLATVFTVAVPVLGDADTILDPLHGFCAAGCQEVTQGGNNVTTVVAPPGFNGANYGFWLSSGPATPPDTRLYFATPDNLAAGPVTTTGTINGASVAGTATLLSGLGQWTSGDLDTFLGSNLPGGAQPNNPISNFLTFTHNTDPTATGYNLFELDLGSVKLAGMDDQTLMNLTSLGLPTGSMIFSFTELAQGNGAWTATASSGVLYDNGGQGCSNCKVVPEPGSLPLMLTGLGLMGLGYGFKRYRNNHRGTDNA